MTHTPDRRQQSYSGMRPLRESLPLVAGRSLRRFGFAQAQIITRWSDIVGPALAQGSRPMRISYPRGRKSGGTLHIRCHGPLALELQHLQPLVLERVNQFCGAKSVTALSLSQGPLPPMVKPAPHAVPDADAQARAQAVTASVHDSRLKTALAGLGAQVFSTTETAPTSYFD